MSEKIFRWMAGRGSQLSMEPGGPNVVLSLHTQVRNDEG
jgi:hypothetical protein